ncbi:unnamed protein product [Triticum turgidum subsp. durum]|uniref:Lachrymatory factor synthase n=1 Tax=Triticum turgidum subsp. durum TaxID=4567 RepID=A0A9R0RQ35_TRITD|nr:unnamed protein product [Triticum turgidum subsp. durum]
MAPHGHGPDSETAAPEWRGTVRAAAAGPTPDQAWALLGDFCSLDNYEVVETNKGFGRYRATIGVEPDPAGCAVRWSFEADPVEGWTLEGFVGFLEKLAHGVAKRLEEEIMANVDGDPAALRVF